MSHTARYKPHPEHCAICGELVPEPEHEFEGPTPRNGEEPERGVLCEPCGEFQEGRQSLAQATAWAMDRILGK